MLHFSFIKILINHERRFFNFSDKRDFLYRRQPRRRLDCRIKPGLMILRVKLFHPCSRMFANLTLALLKWHFTILGVMEWLMTAFSSFQWWFDDEVGGIVLNWRCPCPSFPLYNEVNFIFNCWFECSRCQVQKSAGQLSLISPLVHFSIEEIEWGLWKWYCDGMHCACASCAVTRSFCSSSRAVWLKTKASNCKNDYDGNHQPNERRAI